MPDRPAGAELLAEARRTLLAEVAPGLTGVARFQTLMAANALQIVMRELDHAEALARTEQEALALAGADAKALVAAIRHGDFDHDAACHQALLKATAARVAVWKPDRLTADERRLLEAPGG